jgi:cytochrome c peroxidase
LTIAAAIVATAGATIIADHSSAQVADPLADISPLSGVKPILPDVSTYIRDPIATEQLGKALFWDTQVGSDGQACATCHFHAGADVRLRNQTDPSIRNTVSALQNVFDNRDASLGIAGPNKSFIAVDFPLHKLSDIHDRESGVLFDTNDVFSSQGTYAGDFISANRAGRQDLLNLFLPKSKLLQRRLRTTEKCGLAYNPFDAITAPLGNPFHANGIIYRKVEPRQTPTTINAVFNSRQFWDGRANSQFNGVDPFGPRTYTPFDAATSVGNPSAAGTGILVRSGKNVVLTKPLIDNASLASQAVGPPLSDFEMSCAGKTFADLGAKLLPMKPLSTQVVHPQDSLFSVSTSLIPSSAQTGLKTTYQALVEKAFTPKFWAASGKFTIDPATGAVKIDPNNGHTQEELNFSLFWGLAIQAYEQLLVSDDSPFDHGPAAMSPEAVAGMSLFVGKGKCVACHNGPLFSAATASTRSSEPAKAIEGMLMGNGRPAIYDNGFYNIGVRPTSDDIGVGGIDPYGFDLAFTRQFKWRLLGQQLRSPDRFEARPCVCSHHHRQRWDLYSAGHPSRLSRTR